MNNNNEEMINKLLTTQQELMQAASQQHVALENQRLQIEKLMQVVTSGQETIKVQQEQIDRLKGDLGGAGGIGKGARGSGAIKPPKPDVYKGKRDALEINAWIDQLERYSKHFGLSDGIERVDVAVFYLGGTARDWWTNRSGQLKEKITGWASFIAELKLAFYPLDHERSVMDKLERLSQKGSVSAYVEKFERLRTQISGISDDLWKRYFIKGLQSNIQIEAIKFNLDTPDASVGMLYQRLTTLGDALWAQKGVSKNDPMDLSAMEKSNGKTYAGYKDKKGSQAGEGKKDFKCFKCGLPGHFKRDCGAKYQKRNLNAMEQSMSEQEDFQEGHLN
jgi:polyhydroxyalkanoate synthesis regulator phasin